MANVLAIHSVCQSIATFLHNTYPASVGGIDMPACEFVVLSSNQFAAPVDAEANRISLYLYRVTVNEHARQQRPVSAALARNAPLHLDLHILFSAWSGSAFDEQVMMAWTLRQLHQYPLLDASSLSPEAGWGGDEVIQVVPAELSNEDLMRIWDALTPGYRLSVSCIARTVRLDPDQWDDALPVVATRLSMGEAVLR